VSARVAACTLTLIALAAAYANAQTPSNPAPSNQPVPATPAANPPAPAARASPAAEISKTGRYELQVLAPSVNVYAEPHAGATVLAQLQEGARVEALERRNVWYRITLSDGRSGWVVYAPGRTNPNFSVIAEQGLFRTRPAATGAEPAAPEGTAAPPETQAATGAQPDDHIVQQRPMGKPLEPIIPEFDPRQVPPPSPLMPDETIPVSDRWRLVDQLGVVNMRYYDPYNPNVLKGDRPVFGEDWFLNVSLISDTVYEARRLPTPIGAQSTENPGSNDQFGGERQTLWNQNLIASLSLIKGDTTFRPQDLEIRFTPVFNWNRTEVDEVRVLNVDPRHGTTRNDNFVGIQELFVDYHIRNVSDRYDFDSIRVGIQQFTTDFRGFLYLDQPLGVRLFGTRDNNRYQYNLGFFQRVEKDTNSGLNDLGQPLRKDYLVVANLYRQDTFVPGFTLQGTLIYNWNRETSDYYDTNGFLIRPAVVGDVRPKKYDVGYLGLNGDGHFGRWNVTATAYWALGHDDHNPYSQQGANINAFYGVAEVSRDFDWLRVRGTALFQSGDKNPFDNKENGFDAILEDPKIAGADTSFWIRQAIPLIGGGGVTLSQRNGVLADLRSSKDQGQSNFINPGLTLIGLGADADITPRWRGIINLNELWFNETGSLGVLRQQGSVGKNIGTDLSLAVQYRPLFNQNIILNVSGAVLFPGQGFKDLYPSNGGSTPYSILANLLLTF